VCILFGYYLIVQCGKICVRPGHEEEFSKCNNIQRGKCRLGDNHIIECLVAAMRTFFHYFYESINKIRDILSGINIKI